MITDLLDRYYRGDIIKSHTLDSAFRLANNPLIIQQYIETHHLGEHMRTHNLRACMYKYGWGVVIDLTKAVDYYQKAIESGHSMAFNGLGWCYEEGTGVPRDPIKAVQLYQQASQLGDVSALVHLALCYEEGTGVPKDLVKAVQLYQQASQLGDVIALVNLGVCYEEGTGVPKDLVKAVQLYQQASQLGDVIALVNLGVCYEEGTGVPKDPVKAVQLYQQAVDHNHPNAMSHLANCYLHDQGNNLPQNLDQALQLLIRAHQLDTSIRFDGFFKVLTQIDPLESVRLFQMAIKKNVPGAKEKLESLCQRHRPLNLIECSQMKQRLHQIDVMTYTHWIIKTQEIIGDPYIYQMIGHLIFKNE